MKSQKLKLKLSVGELVDFAARKGDLFADFGAAGPSSAEGIRGHQTVQKSRSEPWQSEVAVKQMFNFDDVELTLSGRIDLLKQLPKKLVIEEIKTTYRHPNTLSQTQKHLHLAQAKVYAYLYSTNLMPDSQCDYTNIDVIVHYYDVILKKSYQEKHSCSVHQLEIFTKELIQVYLDWLLLLSAHRHRVKQSATDIDFPYDTYREGQYDCARHIYQSVKRKHPLLIEAPTGTGKTLSTLFPTIKALGHGLIHQAIYLTAKVSTQMTAIETITLLKEKGLFIDGTVIQAKDKACPCRSNKNNDAHQFDNDGQCSRTIGFFDRLPQARKECLASGLLTPEVIQDIAANHHLCPFELSLQMASWSSVVICDLNYVFDPMVKLACFDKKTKNRAILIDELHNLPARARSMYSASLSTLETKLIKQALSQNKSLEKATNKLIKAIKSAGTEVVSSQPPEGLFNAVENCLSIIHQEHEDESVNHGLTNQLFGDQPETYHAWVKSLYRYYMIHQLFSDSHRVFVEDKRHPVKKNNKESTIHLHCLDASSFIGKIIHQNRAMIGFSATLSPVNFYANSLGLDKSTRSLQLPAIFPEANQLTLLCQHIHTNFSLRDQSIQPISELVYQTYQAKPGKYLVFLPSYQYLSQVYDAFKEKYSDITTICQQLDASDEQRENFISAFFNNADSIIGFAILGGIFAEGIDFKGDALHGAIIVGTGMPTPSKEQKALANYYQNKKLNAFQYAYQYPGFTRVQQTAGRVIRSEHDKGVVILIEPRFMRSDYQQILPSNWHITPVNSNSDATDAIESFWKQTT